MKTIVCDHDVDAAVEEWPVRRALTRPKSESVRL